MIKIILTLCRMIINYKKSLFYDHCHIFDKLLVCNFAHRKFNNSFMIKPNNMIMKSRIILMVLGTLFYLSTNAQDGKTLFTPCSACHTIGGGKLVGPDLAGVLDRRSQDEIIQFVQNPAKFNVVIMPPQNLTAEEIKAILNYIVSVSPVVDQTKEVVSEPLVQEIEEIEGDASVGEKIFEGSVRLENGGPSCVSCHNVDYNQMMQGGMLAADLTNVFARSGGMAGIKGVLTGLPFPAMQAAYSNKTLTESEVAHLQAFLKLVDEEAIYQHHGEKESLLFYFGIFSFILLLVLIFFFWYDRKRRGVKDDIYKRQIKSI